MATTRQNTLQVPIKSDIPYLIDLPSELVDPRVACGVVRPGDSHKIKNYTS